MTVCRFCPRDATDDDVCRYHAAGRIPADRCEQARATLDAYGAQIIDADEFSSFYDDPAQGQVWGMKTRGCASKTFVALQDVLNEHTPKWPGTHCRADNATWPCMTVKLITAALETQ